MVIQLCDKAIQFCLVCSSISYGTCLTFIVVRLSQSFLENVSYLIGYSIIEWVRVALVPPVRVRRAGHQRIAVLHNDRAHAMAGQQAHSLRARNERHGRCSGGQGKRIEWKTVISGDARQ